MKHNTMAIDVRTQIILQCAGDHDNHVQHGKRDLWHKQTLRQLWKNIVLVHGGLVDGSGWKGVYKAPEEGRLHGRDCPESDHLAGRRRGGHEARDRRAKRPGDPSSVTHMAEWWITEVGNDPEVAGLVYVSAFAPDKRRIGGVAHKECTAAARRFRRRILPPQDGYLFLDKAKFPAVFAADVSPDVASFMADSQVPWGVEALSGAITQPAWRTKPSWYLVSTEDSWGDDPALTLSGLCPNAAGSTVVEVKGSHCRPCVA